MLLAEIVLNCPWNVPIALNAKKALLAFLMASSTALLADMSQDHQYHRHLAVGCGVRALSQRMAIGVSSDGFVGDTSTASHLVRFRVSPFSCANLLTVLICACKVAWELLIVCMSSA